MVAQKAFQIHLLLCSVYAIFVQASDLAINSSCETRCGNVSIPYPFGIGAGCYVDDWFSIDCRNSTGYLKPFLSRVSLEVLNISVVEGTVGVMHRTLSICSDGPLYTNFSEISGSPFLYSQSKNIFVALGCDNLGTMRSVDGGGTGTVLRGCMSVCDKSGLINASSCEGINCCQTTVPSDLHVYAARIDPINYELAVSSEGYCKSAFLVEETWFKNDFPYSNLSFTIQTVPVVLDWGILNTSFNSLPIAQNMSSTYTCVGRNFTTSTVTLTFTCSCKPGFRGNPYLHEGCQDIDECKEQNPCTLNGSNISPRAICVNTIGSYNCSFLQVEPDDTNKVKALTIGIGTAIGLLVLLVGGWCSYKVVKKRMMIQRNRKFFKRNGGLLLQQQLLSSEANVESTKLFNSKDLHKATDHFNINRILGQGGQGTVYKGMLADGRIVAVKKSKVIDEGKLAEFINEVVILSQIKQRNIVKLIGCCLETEVPLLVYEYVPNGTLSRYIKAQVEEFPLTWDIRLRIAIEVAGALFYLHSLASRPIYHRDIKSANILLDEKYRAKVADFGTSRSIAVDQTHLTTEVYGSFGYMDPEYFQSNQFTEKSDVYSFGVVLAELLTGEKAISSTNTQESRSLATYFIQSVEENNLFDIIDSRVLKEGKKEEIIAVANLVKRCLNLAGRERPTMKEVAKELEAVQMMRKAPDFQQNHEELEYVRIDMYMPWDASTTSTMSTSSVDVQPLLSS